MQKKTNLEIMRGISGARRKSSVETTRRYTMTGNMDACLRQLELGLASDESLTAPAGEETERIV